MYISIIEQDNSYFLFVSFGLDQYLKQFNYRKFNFLLFAGR